jgi:hypothetical protein
MTLTIDDLLPALTKDMKTTNNKLSDEPQKPILMKDEPQWGALGTTKKNED